MTIFNPNRRLMLKGAVATSAMAVVAAPVFAKIKPARDPFIETLIGRMSLEEKAGQLTIFADPARFDGSPINPTSTQVQTKDRLYDDIANGRLTGLFNGIGVSGAREMQKIAVEKTPNKIPMIFAGDVIHGLKTVFPIPLAEAAAFDTDLAMRTSRAAAIEATAKGLHWNFAPMVDVARDQRWGRVAETAGEDTYLDTQIAQARVRGFQGSDLRAEDSLLACPKHFAAYGAVQGGMDYNTVDIPETTLRETHLPPFKAAFDAGALSTMASFNDIAGVPAHGNRYLLTTILREEWGFKGLVVSDYTGEEELILHGYAADGADAVVKALTAGCDISMQSGLYNKYIPDLVRSGKLPMSVVDTAVRRVLTVKKTLGLFDNPYRSMDAERERTDIGRPETIALAREAGRKSIVLLKNEGNVLPLRKSAKVALIGPSVSDKADLPGPWAVFPDLMSGVTIEAGFRAVLGDRLSVARGAGYEAPLENGINEALAIVRDADVVVLVVGESTTMSGEAQSRVEISVPAPQMALAEAVAAVGKPMVVLLRSGRALALQGAVKDAPAILATWFLGSQTGTAIADILFGDFAPQGRLPVSFPQDSGQQPFYYNRRNTGRPQLTDDKSFKARYREVSNEALYPFGHGLTYSTVVYAETKVSSATLRGKNAIKVSVTLTNTGQRSSHEVAQLYIHDKVATMTQPIRSLKGIQHVDLEPGQSRVVEFELTVEDLAFVHPDLKRTAESGQFTVWIAPSSVGGVPATFELVL